MPAEELFCEDAYLKSCFATVTVADDDGVSVDTGVLSRKDACQILVNACRLVWSVTT